MILKCLLIIALCALFFTPFDVADAARITADNIEHFQETDKYVATGNVRLEKDKAVMKADKAVLYQRTSEAELEGHVVYEDPDVSMTADKATFNLDNKTGVIHNAVILFKKDNYWVTGDSIKKIKDNHYYAAKAEFTTCNAKPYLIPEHFPRLLIADSLGMGGTFSVADRIEKPDWCFKGEDVDIIPGDKLKAKSVVYRIKGVPVLYTPYVWAPINTERQSGFLFPMLGNNSRKGFQFSPAFFWAIDDDKDATFYADYYSKRGLGLGIEYRFANALGVNRWYAYHLKDTELKEDFFEARVTQREQYKNIKGYLDVNYLNNIDYYKEYGVTPNVRIRRFLEATEVNRFLQSSGEVFMDMANSRLYLLGQYWIDLREKDVPVPQRLPEIGYVINPTRIGPLTFTMASSISNFPKDNDTKGQRIDIMPTVSYSFGDTVQVYQSLSLRETAYSLQDTTTTGSAEHRESLLYRANVLTRFIKRYETFTHIVEPSVEYRFIPVSKNLPIFDSTELFNKTSVIEAAIYNIFMFKNFLVHARLSQPYEFTPEGTNESLLPTKLETAITGPFLMKFDIAHDFKKSRIERVNTLFGIRVLDNATLSVGERYDKENKINFYSVGIDTALTKKWSVGASLWYDAEGGGFRESTVRTIYNDQCWAINAAFTKKPGDTIRPAEYIVSFFFELKGIGKFRAL